MNSTRHGLGRNGKDDDDDEEIVERIHPDTIPFKVNGSSLIPLFGDKRTIEHDDEHEDMELSSLTLQPGQNVTLSFSGVIALQPEKDTL